MSTENPKKDEQRRAQLQQRAQVIGLEQEMILKFLQNKAELERISAELSKETATPGGAADVGK